MGLNGLKITDRALEDSLRDVMYALHAGDTKNFENFCSKLRNKFSFDNLTGLL